MADEVSLSSIEERVVEFYGDPISALLVSGDAEPVRWVRSVSFWA